ncbi:MAG: thiol:disulfide interchange protein DsbC [Gammaproteobacteria bacterium]|jgi:thiol:disulfide interchange protein DsbC
MVCQRAQSVRVRYLLYPRAGIPSASYDKTVSVWCAENQHDAMERAKTGEPPVQCDCDTPIAEHMALAQRLPLKGTPFIVTETGRMIRGYVPTGPASK